MNVTAFEALCEDPKVIEKISLSFFYAAGKLTNPNFTAMWAEVPQATKDLALKLGIQAAAALITDYTTPGCKCSYCRQSRKGEKPDLFMCRTRWLKLPAKEREEISDGSHDY